MMIQILSILSFFIMTHDFHVSRTEIHFNDAEEILECSAHIFIDDLEQALQSYTVLPLYIGTEKENEKADSLIQIYLKDHFSLDTGGEFLTSSWVGKEITEDLSAIWIYYYFPWDGKGELRCRNDILMEIFDDQKNMIEYRQFGKPKTILLSSNRRNTILN